MKPEDRTGKNIAVGLQGSSIVGCQATPAQLVWPVKKIRGLETH